jgi:hypothetical protein
MRTPDAIAQGQGLRADASWQYFICVDLGNLRAVSTQALR